nr:chromate transporter [Zoogloeaceae bacterium]
MRGCSNLGIRSARESSILSSAPCPPDQAARVAPRSPGELFVAFTLLALQGFGGVLAVAQRELVDRRRWLTREEFLDAYSLAQLLPGPNVINLALTLGDRFFGWPGALASLAGMLLAPLLIVVALAAGYRHLADSAVVAGALRGMGAVAVGLMFAMGLKMLAPLRRNPMGPWICSALAGATIVLVGVLRLPLLWALPCLGTAGWLIARAILARTALRP